MTEAGHSRDRPSARRRIAVAGVLAVAAVVLVLLFVALVLTRAPTVAEIEPSASGSAVAGTPTTPPSSAAATPTATDSTASATAAPSASSGSAPSQPAAQASVADPVMAKFDGPATLAWVEGPSLGGFVQTMAWLQDRWVAAGDAGGRAAVWGSADGVTWTPAPPIDPAPTVGSVDGGGYYSIQALGDWEGLLVAAGINRFGFGDGSAMALWTSADGIEWEFLDLTATETSHTVPTAVLSPDQRLIVVVAGEAGGFSAVHVTTDAQAWESYAFHPQDMFQSMRDVAGKPPALVGVGGSGQVPVAADRRSTVAVMWSSTDWETWELLVSGAPGSLSAIAYDSEDGRFVAGGNHADPAIEVDGVPVVWLSDDGREWSPVILDTGAGVVFDVAVSNGMIIAVGKLFAARTLAVWESRDGVTWAMTPLVSRGGETPHLATRDGQVLLMAEVCCDAEETRVWTSALE
jgi:hypothetical protein